MDNDSSVNILYQSAFEQMGIEKDKIQPTTTPLVGFTGDKLYPIGVIMLPVIVGASLHQVTKAVDFLVVNCPSTNNAIIGKPTLNKMMTITSTYHLLMCFPTKDGVEEVRGDQSVARDCYVASLKGKDSKEALIIEDMEERDDVQLKQTRLSKDLEELNIDPNCPKWMVHVRSALSKEFKRRLKELLIAYRDVFAWTHVDMPMIDPRVITHRLSVYPSARPIIQKKITFVANRNQAIAEEVDKFLKTRLIREVTYPD